MYQAKNKKWKEFYVKDVLQRLKVKSISNTIHNFSNGDTPVIGNSAFNNGVIKYLLIKNKKYLHPLNCLSYGAKGGLFFYQPHNWSSTDHVHVFINQNLNEDNALFLCTVLNSLVKLKGGWSTGLESNILNEKIKLPIDKNNHLDWGYMSDYIGNLKKEFLNKALPVIIKKYVRY